MTGVDSRFQILHAENEQLRRDLAEAQRRIGELEKLSREDGLTGLVNRRGFDLELQRAHEFSARHGENMALLLLDLDNFKDINDRFGHAGGDESLRHVAWLLRQNVRGSDVVARIGGDEFAIILWRTSGPSSLRKADLLRGLLSRTTLAVAGQPIDTSTSIGVASLEPAYATTEQWFAAADKQLYANKEQRRHLRQTP